MGSKDFGGLGEELAARLGRAGRERVAGIGWEPVVDGLLGG